jgi:nucleotide-binding universal stress UspA family protein
MAARIARRSARAAAGSPNDDRAGAWSVQVHSNVKTYLVALDSSPRARHVLAAAIGLAQATTAKLVLFRAVGLPGDLPIEAYAMPPDAVVGVLEDRARKDLAEASRMIPEGVRFETRVQTGTAWEAICEAGKAVGAGLIVLGSHGYSGIDRLLGTTAARVVNHADRSVLVVRDPELLGPRTSTGEGPAT